MRINRDSFTRRLVFIPAVFLLVFSLLSVCGADVIAESDVTGLEAGRWLPQLTNSTVIRLLAHGCGLKDADIQAIAALHGLKDLEIPYNHEVTDLTPLLASETLERLFISADMRGALKNITEGTRFEIVMDESNYGLLSLDELDTLSMEQLAKVKTFSLVGDQLLAEGREHFENNWGHGLHSYDIVDNQTGKRRSSKKGLFTNLDRLLKLTGLERLELAGQPLETLDGIQNLTKLREASFSGARFTDASALFEIAGLERISFDLTPVASLAGFQNLKRVEYLNLNDSQVSDISVFKETDFSYAYGRGGLSLSINGIPCKDLSPLAAVRSFSGLHVIGMEASRWLPHLANSTITCLLAHGCGLRNDDIPVLAALAGLKELEISNNTEVTDLTPLLFSDTLERLTLTRNMEKAIQSLGEQVGFEVIIGG